MLLDNSHLVVSESQSILGFQTEWDRFLTIDGKKAYNFGNVCGTCAFLFERLEGANQGIDTKAIISELNEGFSRIQVPVINALKLLLPNGSYKILLQTIEPHLIQPGKPGDYFYEEQVNIWGIDGFWGISHHPKTEYYRLKTLPISEISGLFEFLIPMYPKNWLSDNRITEYKSILQLEKHPTAISLSILDVKQPACWDDSMDGKITDHWCLAHNLIDGHHKVFAASQENRPITLLSFLAIDQGCSSKENVNTLLRFLNSDSA